MGEGTVVKRWRRFGHDRLYVTVDGDQLGYWDHSAQTLHPRTPEVESDLRQALDRHWASGGPPPKAAVFPEAAEQPAAAEVPVPAAPPAMERPWTDLAASPAGAALRDRAVAAREAAPVKTLLGRLLQVHTDERAWRIGAAGEQAVAARLARLPDSWRVLHAVPVGSRGSDIDHVVIGPGGVYTINTKHHPQATVWVGGNTFLVDGRRQPYIRNSRHEAARASQLLTQLAGFPVFVVGLVVVVGAQRGWTIKSQPPGGDVHVLTRKQVADWLLQRGRVLPAEQVETLFEIARRSTTWTGVGVAPTGHAHRTGG